MIRAIGAATLMVVALWCSPLAKADSVGDEVYLDGIHDNAYSRLHTDSEWLAEAQRVCDAHLSGTSDDQLIDMVQADLNLPSGIAPSVVGSAEGSYGC